MKGPAAAVAGISAVVLGHHVSSWSQQHVMSLRFSNSSGVAVLRVCSAFVLTKKLSSVGTIPWVGA